MARHKPVASPGTDLMLERREGANSSSHAGAMKLFVIPMSALPTVAIGLDHR